MTREMETKGMASKMAQKLRFLPVFTGLCLASLVTFSAPAFATAIYTVEAVPVDVTAKSAVDARPQAMSSGQLKAFEILMRRMLNAEDVSKAIALPPSVIASFVQGMSIANERASSVRYIANMTVKFSPTKVRDYLKGRSFAYSDTLASPAVVVPILRANGQSYLWESENLWHRAWAQHDLRNRLVPLILPRGNEEDQALVARPDAAGGANLTALAARYGASDALVAEANISSTEAGYAVTVRTSDLQSGAPAYENIFIAATEQDLPRALEIAATSVAAHLDGWWKSRTMMQMGDASSLTVTVPLRQLSDWSEVQRRLEKVTLVQSADLRTLRVGEAELLLNLVGELEQLKTFLASAGLTLTEAEGGHRLMLQEMASGTY